MKHTLEGYQLARNERHKYLVTRGEGGSKTFYAGASGFTDERDAATRLQARPHEVLIQLPDAKLELA